MKQTRQKHKRKAKQKWPWIIVGIALLAVTAAAFAGARIASEKGQTACAYLRGGSLYLQRTPGDDPLKIADAFDESGGAIVSQTASGDLMLYPSNLQKAADGSIRSYDLYAASTRGREAGKSFLIAQSVSGSPIESADGKSILYLRGEAGGTGTLCTYHLDGRQETVIDSGVSSFQYSGGKEPLLCYLKKDGSTQNLYAFADSKKTELDRNVSEYRLYPTQTTWELFYLKAQDQSGVFSLYKKSGSANAQLVAEGVASARFDQYVPGGPLYYLCPSGQLSWSDLIEDDRKDEDAALQEPKLSDFIGGVLDSLLNFGDYGSGAYHTALTEYNEKLKRDKIREELSELDSEELFGGTFYDCYAFTGTSSLLLAENLREDSLFAAACTTPAIVSRSYTLNQKDRLKLSELGDDLIAQAQEEGWQVFLGKLAQQALSSPSLKFTAGKDGKAVPYSMDQYSQDASFCFTDDGSQLYLLEDMEAGGTLLRAAVSQSGLTEKTAIDTNVSRFIVAKDTVYYLKGSNVQSGTLYKFTYSESVLIENEVRALEELPDGNLLYYRKSADGNTALFLIQDGEQVLLGEHVLLGSAAYASPERVLWIRNPDAGGAGELCWRRSADKTSKIDENVQKVLF